MAGQAAPDPSGLGMLSASYGPTAAAQRSQDLAQALAAMRVPADDVGAPVDPVGDRLAEALMQRKYGPSVQDLTQTNQPVLSEPVRPSGVPPTAFFAHAPTPDPFWLPSGSAVTAPTSDDPIPASPWGPLHYGEVSFDDLIPNPGASWRPSSSGAAGAPSGQTLGEAISAGPVQESQTQQQTPNGGGGSPNAATLPHRWKTSGMNYFGADGEYGHDGVGSTTTATDVSRGGSLGDASPQAGVNPFTVQEVVVTAPRAPTVIDHSPRNFAEDLRFILTHPTMSLAYAKQSANDAASNFVSGFEGSVHNIARHVDQLPGQVNEFAREVGSYLTGVAHDPAAAVHAAPGQITGAASQLTSTLNTIGPNIENRVDGEINSYGAAWRQGGAHDVVVRAAGDLGAAAPMVGMASASFALPELAELDAPAIAELGDAADAALNPIVRQFPTVDRSATGIVWGRGIQDQGGPWETYLAVRYSKKGTFPTQPNFKTWDFFNDETGEVVSAKTLDTTTQAKISDPSQVYYSLKANIDEAVKFTRYKMNRQTITSDMIVTRTVEVAVPGTTTAEQWNQIRRAIAYAGSKGVNLVITVVK